LSTYSIEIEEEVEYCEFVYAVSATFLFPVSAYALVGHLLSPFCSLLRHILRLSTVSALFDVKRRSASLLPVLVKPKVVLTDEQWQIGPYIVLIVQWQDPTFLTKLVWSINNHFFAFLNSS